MRDNLHNIRLRKEGDQLSNLDHVTTNAYYSLGKAQLYIFEDHGAVIKMIIKGRSAMMRHVSSSHRVVLDWLFDRINLDPENQIKYVDTTRPTRWFIGGGFTRDEWCKDNTSKDPFSRCAICKNYGYSLS